jgi:hypothetical protein
VLEDVLERSTVEGVLWHGLGALEAMRLRRLERAVPAAFLREERSALFCAGIAAPLLRHVRRSTEAPLVLIKGPEVARLYPPNGRAFGDIDLLTPEPETVQRSLLEAGFKIDERALTGPHHLEPLILDALPLKVEVHSRVKWPVDTEPPSLDEILEASIPSGLGIEGLLAPNPAHHALILAAHSWEHRPLRLVRDLLDVTLISDGTDEEELKRTAVGWSLAPIWRTTREAMEGVLFGGRVTFPLRSWARHLAEVREPTVLESHLEHLMSPFWGQPLRGAITRSVRTFRDEVSPLPGERWRDKAVRASTALRHARMPRGEHEDALLSAGRLPPPSDGL